MNELNPGTGMEGEPAEGRKPHRKIPPLIRNNGKHKLGSAEKLIYRAFCTKSTQDTANETVGSVPRQAEDKQDEGASITVSSAVD